MTRPDPPRTPPGWRAYAVGDVHGRLDLLDQILAAIGADCEDKPADKIGRVILGDLIGRGRYCPAAANLTNPRAVGRAEGAASASGATADPAELLFAG